MTKYIPTWIVFGVLAALLGVSAFYIVRLSDHVFRLEDRLARRASDPVTNRELSALGVVDSALQERSSYLVALRIDSVNAEDGVSRSEAEILADNFFALFFGACGGPSFKGEDTDSWIYVTAVGIGGAPGPEINVRKDGKTLVDSKGFVELLHHQGVWFYDERRSPFYDAILEARKRKG